MFARRSLATHSPPGYLVGMAIWTVGKYQRIRQRCQWFGAAKFAPPPSPAHEFAKVPLIRRPRIAVVEKNNEAALVAECVPQTANGAVFFRINLNTAAPIHRSRADGDSHLALKPIHFRLRAPVSRVGRSSKRDCDQGCHDEDSHDHLSASFRDSSYQRLQQRHHVRSWTRYWAAVCKMGELISNRNLWFSMWVASRSER